MITASSDNKIGLKANQNIYKFNIKRTSVSALLGI